MERERERERERARERETERARGQCAHTEGHAFLFFRVAGPSETVRERLLRDEASQPYLQRKHHVLSSSGFATRGPAERAPKQRMDSIFDKLKEDRELA